MSLKRNIHDRAAKLHAVRRVIQDGHCPRHVAADLDIKTEQVHNWIRRYATPMAKTPSRLRLKTPIDELQELRRDSESLKLEQEFFREILDNVRW